MSKILDCQDFDKDMRGIFFDNTEAGNDCYIDFEIDIECAKIDENEDLIKLYNYLIKEWKCHDGETYVIKHWW